MPKYITYLAMCLTTIQLCSCTFADPVSRPQTTVLDWYNQPWTDSSAPYEKLRKSIIARGQQALQQLLADERQSCLAETIPNPLDVYQYCYTDWLYLQLPQQSYDVDPDPDAYNLITTVADWRSYDYVRQRFLIESASGAIPGDFQAGQLLLSHDPNDYDVIRGQLNVLWGLGRDPVTTKLAFTLCKRLLTLKPEDPATYESVGTVYYVSSSWDHKIAERQYATRCFEHFQSIAAPDDSFLPVAKNWISDMKTGNY